MEDKGRLINAYDAVIKISGKVTPILQKHGSKPRGIYLAVLEALAECPTVEAEVIAHGKWEYGKWEEGHWVKGNERCRCSVCHRDFAVDNLNIWNGCPHCLARMDGITDKC